MPLVHVELIEGRSDEAKKKMAQELLRPYTPMLTRPKSIFM